MCKDCIAPETWNPEGGELISISALSEWILNQKDIEGITFSGGEPMNQAQNLIGLIDAVRSEKDLGIVCYTGYTLEELEAKGSVHQKNFLKKIDLLIDGKYMDELHTDLLWRGSSNQRLICLTNRYTPFLHTENVFKDRSAGLEFYVEEDGDFGFIGVPSTPGFRDKFYENLKRGMKDEFSSKGE